MLFRYALPVLACCSAAMAATIFQEVQVWEDPLHISSVRITTTVFDNYNGDYSRREWQYTLENINHDALTLSLRLAAGRLHGGRSFWS